MAAIAIDLGGTTIKLGIVDKGIVIASATMPSAAEGTIEQNMQQSSVEISKLLQQKNIAQQELNGIGISFPGIVDTKQNRVVSDYVKYKGANKFDFDAWAYKKWQLVAAMENDARAALVGEWQYGAGKGCDNIVMLTLGTGVGSAVIAEGRLLRGSHFIGGSLAGHISINLNGAACSCGYFGCVETEASTWVLPAKASAHNGFGKSTLSKIPSLQFKNLFTEADKGDMLAKQLLKECLAAWGVCAVNTVHAHDPEMVIIGGGIMKQATVIIPFIQQMIDQYAWLPKGTIKVVAAQQTEFAALLGMEYLIKSKHGNK